MSPTIFGVLALAAVSASASHSGFKRMANHTRVATVPGWKHATTVSGTAYYGFQNDTMNACGTYSKDSDMIIGVGPLYYGDMDTPSSKCFQHITVALASDPSKKSIDVTLTDACADCNGNGNVYLSPTAFQALSGGSLDAGVLDITWSFGSFTNSAGDSTPASSSGDAASTGSSDSSSSSSTDSSSTGEDDGDDSDCNDDGNDGSDSTPAAPASTPTTTKAAPKETAANTTAKAASSTPGKSSASPNGYYPPPSETACTSSVTPPRSSVTPPTISSVTPPISSVMPPISSVTPPASLAAPPTSSAAPPTSSAAPPTSPATPPTSPQCCDSVLSSTSGVVSAIAGLLGLDLLSDLDVLVGLSCSPITVIGNNCGSTTVNCEAPKEEWGGLIAINCLPVTL